MALVGEPGRGGNRGGRCSVLQQQTGSADAVRDVQCMWRQSSAFAEEADETELPDSRGGGEFVSPSQVTHRRC